MEGFFIWNLKNKIRNYILKSRKIRTYIPIGLREESVKINRKVGGFL